MHEFYRDSSYDELPDADFELLPLEMDIEGDLQCCHSNPTLEKKNIILILVQTMALKLLRMNLL